MRPGARAPRGAGRRGLRDATCLFATGCALTKVRSCAGVRGEHAPDRLVRLLGAAHGGAELQTHDPESRSDVEALVIDPHDQRRLDRQPGLAAAECRDGLALRVELAAEAWLDGPEWVRPGDLV